MKYTPTQAARDWMPRLVHRKYTELADPRSAGHFSARIEHEGTGCYFPLGSADAEKAAARAAEIERLIQTKGWHQAGQRYTREFTLAVFWNSNPLLCTYTTLFTAPGRRAADPRPRGKGDGTKGGRILIVDANDAIRFALGRWAQRLPGCSLVGLFASREQAQARLKVAPAEVILFNRSLPDFLPVSKESGAGAAIPTAIAFGIYETSDDIFISHTGVRHGYFLHRTHPAEVLAPLTGAWTDGTPVRPLVLLQPRKYFQDLIGGPPVSQTSGEQAALTPREQEILLRLSKGFQDKQIADNLDISTWTVHNHIKKIFKKLGVHTRTQAVIKHLQK